MIDPKSWLDGDILFCSQYRIFVYKKEESKVLKVIIIQEIIKRPDDIIKGFTKYQMAYYLDNNQGF